MQLVVLVLLLLVRAVHADVGVVVAGDPNMQTPVLSAVQRWVQDKKHTLVAAPLGDATSAMVDCFVMDDIVCATKVFEEHARATNVIFVRVDMQAERVFTLNAFWFVKGKPPVNEKRPCSQCDDTAMGVAVDALMVAIAQKASGGKGHVTIQGHGLLHVKLDGTDLGAAPIERDVPAGSHELVFLDNGDAVEVQRIEVGEAAAVTVTVPAARPARHLASHAHSRALPAALLAGGIVAAAAGGTFLYYGSLRGPDEPYVYTHATEIGLPLVIAGAFAVGAGTTLWIRSSSEDSSVGVQGAF